MKKLISAILILLSITTFAVTFPVVDVDSSSNVKSSLLNAILSIKVPVITEWTSFTPDIINDGGISYYLLGGKYRRVGENMEIEIKAGSTQAGSGSNVVKILYPEVDGQVISVVNNIGSAGVGREYNIGSSDSLWHVFDITVNNDGLIMQQNGTGGAYVGNHLKASSQLYLRASVQVSGWTAHKTIKEMIIEMLPNGNVFSDLL